MPFVDVVKRIRMDWSNLILHHHVKRFHYRIERVIAESSEIKRIRIQRERERMEIHSIFGVAMKVLDVEVAKECSLRRISIAEMQSRVVVVETNYSDSVHHLKTKPK